MSKELEDLTSNQIWQRLTAEYCHHEWKSGINHIHHCSQQAPHDKSHFMHMCRECPAVLEAGD